MTLEGEFEPSPTKWVRDQVDEIARTGDTRSVSVMDRPVVLLTMRGASSGRIRKVPLMRVEHDGDFLAVASKGGAPEHPAWYHNLLSHPEIELQDGTESWSARARVVEEGAERAAWWERAVAAYPPYAEYQTKTDRLIPLFVLEKI